MSRRVTVAVVVVVLLFATLLLGFSAENGYCLPWQERVGRGDGPLGPADDFSTCR